MPKISRTIVIGFILVAMVLFTTPAGAAVRFRSYTLKGVAQGAGPTAVTFKATWRCSGADTFGVHVWLYSFDTGQTIWDKKLKGPVRRGAGSGTKRVSLNLSPGHYLVASSNALCWMGNNMSDGVGQRGLRCWNTFEVTGSRVIAGDSFDGDDCV